MSTSTGTMAGYDADTRQLTVSSASGSSAFHLAPDVRVWLGNRLHARIPAAAVVKAVYALLVIAGLLLLARSLPAILAV